MTIDSFAIDTSALAAILFVEEDARLYGEFLARHPGSGAIAAPTLLECRMVVEGRLGPAGGALLSDLVRQADIEIAAVDERSVSVAMTAWRRFGRGRHAAALNFGDCFAYALAKGRGVPLLYKGRDFSQTDIAAAV